MPTKPGHITSERARELAAMRKTCGSGGARPGSGRPAKRIPCPHCGDLYGASALRGHKPRCQRNPRNR